MEIPRKNAKKKKNSAKLSKLRKIISESVKLQKRK